MLITGRLSLKKMIGFRGWPRIGKSGPGGAQGLNVNNWSLHCIAHRNRKYARVPRDVWSHGPDKLISYAQMYTSSRSSLWRPVIEIMNEINDA